MGTLLGVVSIAALAVALLAFRRVFLQGREIKQLKRDHYYTETRLKRVPEDIRDAVEPLRAQVASLVDGKPVSSGHVLAGRSYLDVSAADAQRMLEEKGGPQSGHALLVDVRSPKEYVVKHAQGAKLVPFEQLEARYKEEIPDTVEKVFIYCLGGDRSRLACDFLSRKGYTNLYNVQDGMQGWRGPTEGEGEVRFIHFEPRR